MAKTQFSVLLCLSIVVGIGFLSGSWAKEIVGIYELKKGNFSVKFTNWGATIMSLVVPDKHGKLADVVLGYDKVKIYKNDSVYFGAIVGRVANRIAGAQFTLDGKHYKLVANEGKNMLHGGPKGFSDVVWEVKQHINEGQAPRIVFAYRSFDGEEGFPGNLHVTVAYTILKDNQLNIEMKAKALNKATPVNLAQHAYWNLGGHDSGDVLSQVIQIFASHYTPVDSKLIPTGKVVSVKGTPYDFLEPYAIKSKIDKLPNGYDINYALNGGSSHKLSTTAIVYDKKSGRKMELLTNQPGVQFYTGNYLQDVKGKHGAVYQAHAGLCLETQGFPDAVNHPNFPSQIVRPGHTYKHHMLFKFSTH
ncbi:aldose 1-epimerase-like [Tripterygium wilfordii]|uniref:Aldose 1-epimerase n=1 Tax=Tripterygium wilfordii TaxID=458696 RepID=A0A7J7CNA8_TRIWF|nr:galactose mutarotase-like [Tripterygium wilfordii]KAF5735531.1 aldose 1-epimerase-like [Tripterygium wilfordii]